MEVALYANTHGFSWRDDASIYLSHVEVEEMQPVRVVTAARRIEGRSVVVTFHRHPLAVLDPARCPPAVTSPVERAALLASYGIDTVIGLEFDQAVAALSAREFLA